MTVYLSELDAIETKLHKYESSALKYIVEISRESEQQRFIWKQSQSAEIRCTNGTNIHIENIHKHYQSFISLSHLRYLDLSNTDDSKKLLVVLLPAFYRYDYEYKKNRIKKYLTRITLKWEKTLAFLAFIISIISLVISAYDSILLNK